MRRSINYAGNFFPYLIMAIPYFKGDFDYGHFILNENSYPTFKNSIIVQDHINIKFELLREVLNYAILESEKFFPILQLVLWGGKKAEEAILFFDFKTEGKA